MNINLNTVKNYLGHEFQFVVTRGGELCGHTIHSLNQSLAQFKQAAYLAGNQGLTYIRNDSRIAGITIAVSNLVFVETAYLVAVEADRCLDKVFGLDENLTETGILMASVFVTALCYSTIVGLNVALYKGLKSPLSPAAAMAISIATCASYIFIRLWSAQDKES